MGIRKRKGKGVGRCEVEKIKGMRRRVTMGGGGWFSVSTDNIEFKEG